MNPLACWLPWLLLIIVSILFLVYYAHKEGFSNCGLGDHMGGIDHISVFINEDKLKKAAKWYGKLLGETPRLQDGSDKWLIPVGTAVLKITNANYPTPWKLNSAVGSTDICFRMDQPIENTIRDIQSLQHDKSYLFYHYGTHGHHMGTHSTEPKIYNRHGSYGMMRSVYVTDPWGNLLEFAHYS